MSRGPFHRSPPHASSRAGGAALRGFTLIEILVALTLGILILLALTILFSRNTSNNSELERNTRQLEGARYALDMMSEDLMHAGYFGEFNPNPLIVNAADVTMPNPCATGVTATAQGWNTPNPPNPLSVTAADRVQIPVAVQGIAAATAVACLANRVAGTEAVVVRHAETGAPTLLAAAAAASAADNLYIQITRCRTDVSRIRVAPGGSADFDLQLPDCATVNNVLRRVAQRTYFIANDGIPTLKRVEMIDGALHTMSVAEGVENLQVEYGLDTNNDGQPDNFVTMGSAVINGVAPNVWQNVVAVRIHLLTRSTEPTPGFTDQRTYRLGPDVAASAPADGNKRTLLTTTVRLNNVGGRRE